MVAGIELKSFIEALCDSGTYRSWPSGPVFERTKDVHEKNARVVCLEDRSVSKCNVAAVRRRRQVLYQHPTDIPAWKRLPINIEQYQVLIRLAF
jgi:hypothetical protein